MLEKLITGVGELKMSDEQGQGDAQQMLWSNPDLVEKLLPFLDAQSTLCLVQSEFTCTLDLLQDTENPSIWIKLIGRSLTGSPTFEGADALDSDALAQATQDVVHGALSNLLRANFERKRTQVVPLIAILKLMEDPNPQILHLLEAIVQKYPQEFGGGILKMSCPCTTQFHSVSFLGFLLLEEVELAFGSANQEISSLEYLLVADQIGLAALASRESRQGDKMTRLHFDVFFY